MSSSSDKDEGEIDKYHCESNSSGSTSESSNSESSSSNEHYTSGVPLEVLQEELRQRTASGSSAGPSTSVPASIPSPSEEEDILYCCAIGIPSRTNKKKLSSFSGWYQIPGDLNPCLAVLSEWCCTPNLGFGMYKAYLLRGLRLPLNAFVREILHRLGIGINQLNNNALKCILVIYLCERYLLITILNLYN